MSERPLPQATVRPERRLTWAWLVPLAALLLAGWLGFSAWRARGTVVTVIFAEGHGLKVGDPVRFRGANVGVVREIALGEELETIRVQIALRSEADRLARAGSRFWIVRPELRISGVEGLETLLGPKYINVLAPDRETAASRLREFVGLDDPPVVASIAPGDLEIVLAAPRRGSLSRGAPVTYRQVRVGTVLSVGLSSDGGLVEARVHVLQPYRTLVRAGTRFWDAGGVRGEFGLSGLQVEIGSLEQVVAGGVALATPPVDEAGPAVRTGHRFALAETAEEDWLRWTPAVAVGSNLLPPGAVLPHPLRATIEWRRGFLIKGARRRTGWVLQTPRGLLGPPDLLTADPDDRAERESIHLEVAGRAVPLTPAAITAAAGLTRLDTQVSDAVWPETSVRVAETPEDCIAVGDPAASPVPLAASRLRADGARRWVVDPAVSLDPTWHGACVLSRRDGALVGMLLIEDERVTVALVDAGVTGGGG